MYVPDAFAFAPADEASAADIAASHPFAALVVTTGGGMEAAHVPFLFDRCDGSHGRLRAHVARANPIWQAFDGREAVVIFQGPHCYISPDWYATEGLVPTWNYVAMHAYGAPAVMEDETEVRRLLADLSAVHEGTLAPKTPWTLDRLAEDRVRALLKGIVAFEMPLVRIVAKRKLSQNRPPADVSGVIGALRARRGDDNLAIAELMDGQRETSRT